MDLRTDATKAAFFRCQCLIQQRLREMQDAWMIRKAEEIQGSMKLFAANCDNFGLHINTKKTVVMHQPPPTYNVARINVNGAQLKFVDSFTYLGNNLSLSTKINDEVNNRIIKASHDFGCMQNVV
ncbi:unnamed protein product [Schistocephalus solidus]|uniref:Reverse transcriptase domain-containing protein n=1 Tax=Schistocephalus solidus TaxID=70667 RepID=A0A183TAH5_SCHSO|nr:unnamed protein product [Schistocephalus solidus]